MDLLTRLLEEYGYLVLFLALSLEMLALPLPGEFLMSYAGLIVFEGKLNWALSILVAGTAACLGMSLSYRVGYRFGRPFFEKYGRRLHLGPDKLDKVSGWFQKYGNKLLIFAYFIPGVRHITGYFAGTTRISFRKFAAYAYSGAFIWVSFFISLGKLLGPKWEQYHRVINRYMVAFALFSAVLLTIIYVYRNYKSRYTIRLSTLLDKGLKRYQSMGRMKFIVISAFVLFVLFFSLTLGLIQDLLAHEFVLFDEVVFYLADQAFNSDWTELMNIIALLGSVYVLIPLILLTTLWIWKAGKNRLLEFRFFVAVIIGGEILDEILRLLFHRIGPAGSPVRYSFPSEQSFISLTICGFAAYLLVRHYGNLTVRLSAVLIVTILCLSVGISQIFFHIRYPSDVAAGYVFGGTWLTLNVILLEIFRSMRSYG